MVAEDQGEILRISPGFEAGGNRATARWAIAISKTNEETVGRRFRVGEGIRVEAAVSDRKFVHHHLRNCDAAAAQDGPHFRDPISVYLQAVELRAKSLVHS